MCSGGRRASPGREARTSATSPRSALGDLDRELKAAGTPARARGEKAYLKSDLTFYGTPMPEIRRIAADYARTHADLDRRDLRSLAGAAFKTHSFELRSVALALADRRRALLEDRDLPWLLDLVELSKTWAHVDWLAASIIGDVVARYPASRRWLLAWAKHKNFWIRRTAILAPLKELSRGEGDWPMWTRMADSMLHEKEFFIRKAIGWVLRETSKKRPKLVFDYLLPRRDRVSGLTLREGAKYLSDAQRKRLGLAPWRDREGAPYARLR